MWSFVFLLGVLGGIWFSINRNRWFGVWVGLELNLICFIPFIIQENRTCGEPSVKYFLVQACASFLLFFRGVRIVNYIRRIKVLISVSLLIKIGAAPFYFWYLWVGDGLKWLQFLFLRTIQKTTPLVLLFFRGLNKTREVFINLRIISRGLVGRIGGINEISLRKLLIYSSLNHIGWIILPLVAKNEFWLIYFLFYCLIIIIIVWILSIFKLYHINQIFRVRILWVRKLTLIVSFLSLGGLPPLLGFFPKFVVIERRIRILMLFSLLFLIVSSVITLFYYLRAGLSVLLLNRRRIKSNFIFYEIISIVLVLLVILLGGWVRAFLFQRFLQ